MDKTYPEHAERDACLLIFRYGKEIFDRLKEAGVKIYDIHLENHVGAPEKVSLYFNTSYNKTSFRFALVANDFSAGHKLKFSSHEHTRYALGECDDEIQSLLEVVEQRTPCYWPEM